MQPNCSVPCCGSHKQSVIVKELNRIECDESYMFCDITPCSPLGKGRECSTHGEKRNAYRILVGKPEGKRPFKFEY
jgi:hypothetical protein